MEARVVLSKTEPPENRLPPSKTICFFQSCFQMLDMFLIMPRWLRGRLNLVLGVEHFVLQTYIGIPATLGSGPAPTRLPSVPMNINLNAHESQELGFQQPQTTLRIGLLDSGACCNMISHRAHAALSGSIRPCQASIQGVAGDTELCGSTMLDWRFLPDDQQLVGSSKVYRDEFFILPQSDKPLFDCILGWPWIARNLSDVQKLLVANAEVVLG